MSIHETVREHYAERIKNSAVSCCGSDGCCTPESNLYPVDLLTTVPSDVAGTSYGCGDPITLAALKPGQTVLDLGSGAGLDCFLAAQKVGENVEFRYGYLENLPVESNSIDVIISNCVINLSPDKIKVFHEAFRVLAPGGKLSVSDIVTNGPLPHAVKQSLSAWAGCVAGAVEADDYVGMMKSVGFTDVAVTPVFFDKETVDAALADMGDALDLQTISRDDVYKAIYSAKITAYKPVQ
jgi:SAM-dependent methyltransferase